MIVNQKYAPTASAPDIEKTQFPGVRTAISGFRYYSPTLGRFICRDPKEEDGGRNLYAFLSNQAVNRWDYLGLSWNSEGEDDGWGYLGQLDRANSGDNSSAWEPLQWSGDAFVPVITEQQARGLTGGARLRGGEVLTLTNGHVTGIDGATSTRSGTVTAGTLQAQGADGAYHPVNANGGVETSDVTASTSLFLGQQLGDAGAVRQNYINTVASLDPGDTVGRTAAKVAARADTPPLIAGVIQSVRPGTGPNPGSVGRANVTNASANSLGRTLRIGGTVLMMGGVVYDVIIIVTSDNPYRTAAGALGGWLGAAVGGRAGALGGTALYPGAGTLAGGISGAITGSYVGQQSGFALYDYYVNKTPIAPAAGGGSGGQDTSGGRGP